ncbi:MAG: YfiR family protein [Vicinamibacteria bacterium]|nr:YfiR family protein [Vicinamibacteria bacterium]
MTSRSTVRTWWNVSAFFRARLFHFAITTVLVFVLVGPSRAAERGVADPADPSIERLMDVEATSASRKEQHVGETAIVARCRSVKELGPCRGLFISEPEYDMPPDIFEALAGRGPRAVGDAPRFAARGGVIGFTMERNRVRFEIDIEAAARAKNRISSRLLRLARVARDEPGDEGG